MGASIWMRPGTVRKSLGKEVSITPVLRSRAVSLLENMYGAFPVELTMEDFNKFVTLDKGASLYVDEKTMWRTIAEAIEEHGCVTIGVEY